MAKKNSSTLLYSLLNKMITYLKGRNDNILTKQLFVDVRDTFPLEYNTACRFYNTTKIKSLQSVMRFLLNKSVKEVKKSSNNTLIDEQYKSMMKTVEQCYDNINFDNLKSIIGEMSEEERANNKELLRLLIKALILLQLINNIKDVLDTTIENNGKFEFISEHQNNLSYILTEHIIDYNDKTNYSFEEDKKIQDTITLILDEMLSDEDNRDIRKYYEDDLFVNDKDSDLYQDNIYDEDYDDKQNSDRLDELIDPNNLDRFISKTFLKECILLKSIYNSLIDITEFQTLPSISYLSFISIILLLHITQKF